MSSELTANEVVGFDGVDKRYVLGSGAWTGDLRDDAGRWLRRLAGRSTPRATVDALCDVSFRVRRGDNVALIGANGAGKSTALKLIARITVPTRGVVQVRGRVASLIQIGAGFHRELTGRENVYLYGAILGLTRTEIRARFGAIVAFAGLARFIDTPVKRYSTGMFLRLGFSVAVHAEADVLLVDEVLAVGDREFRERSLDRMRELVAGETTLLFVSHQRDLVETACDRALLLSGGQLVFDGNVADAWRAYEQERPLSSPAQSPGAVVTIACVELLDGEGHPRPVAVERDPVTIRIELAARRDVAGATCVVEVRRGATRLFLSSSEEQLAPASLPAGGRTTLEIRVPSLALLPADYRLDVEARVLDEGRSVRADRVVVPLLVEGTAAQARGIVSLDPRWSRRGHA